jgi:hypothetical protein
MSEITNIHNEVVDMGWFRYGVTGATLSQVVDKSPMGWYLLIDKRKRNRHSSPKEYAAAMGEYLKSCKELAVFEHSLPCVIGDILNMGEDIFSEDWSQATVYFAPRKYQTLMNYRSTCKQVPIQRRVFGLHFGHYQAVQSFEPDEQIAYQEKALAEGWKPDQLRRYIKTGSPDPVRPKLSEVVRQDAERVAERSTDYADISTIEVDQLLNEAYNLLLDAAIAAENVEVRIAIQEKQKADHPE